MKNRIGIAIIAVVSILSSFFVPGCSIGSAYILIDSRSDLMKPTFCLYWDPYFQKQLDIGKIVVCKALRSSDAHTGTSNFDLQNKTELSRFLGGFLKHFPIGTLQSKGIDSL